MQRPVGTLSAIAETPPPDLTRGPAPGSVLDELEKAPSEVRSAGLPANFCPDQSNPFRVGGLTIRTTTADERHDAGSDDDSLSYESHLTTRHLDEFDPEGGSLHAPSPVALTPTPAESVARQRRRPHSAPPAIHSR